MSLATPRLLPEHLHAFVASPNNRTPNTVRLLATVSALRGEYATVTCGTHGDVTLILNRDSHIQVGRLVDIIGRVVEVEGGLGIRVLSATDCGDTKDFDYKIYEHVVDATHRFKEIFYDTSD